MKMKRTLFLSIAVLLLAAIASPGSAAPMSTAPRLAALTTPGAINSTFLALVDRGVDFSTSTAYTISSSSSYAPQPGDIKLKRDVVYLDLANSKLLVSATLPTKVEAVIAGNLPDPCHLLRAVVGPVASNNTIIIQVYSLVDPSTACITVLKPFSITIPLGTFTSGTYTVMVNDLRLGSFTIGAATTSSVNK